MKTEFDDKQLQALVEELRAKPDAVGDHLDDEAMGAWTMDMLEGEAWDQVDRHLAFCPECAAEVEALFEAHASWQTAEGQKQLAKFSARMKAFKVSLDMKTDIKEFVDWIKRQFTGGLYLSPITAASGTDEGGVSEDGAFGWHFESLPNDALVIRISSTKEQWANRRLRIRQGTWTREFELRPEDDQFYARVDVSAEERREMDPNSQILLEEVES